ncbi:hypothetical protein [Clostridioides difficile]|uniref:hypothetical protein n=1 Tax=Clostridioides difficile TaxID=1496 RepID=UPI001C16C7FB|nr:hypothetical protein [Clostridioides difficile]HBF6291367.1 hypothetical protein [Clostridioides difficile]HBG4071403.1 hypothetical protein [Clostridioides difficile]HBY2690095.1 hypothetical protein [Clostridioides difficile]HDO9121447.1 hypothetical protein [Clostridioides difficile]
MDEYIDPNYYVENSDKWIPHLDKSYLKEIYSYTGFDLSCFLWSNPTGTLTKYLYKVFIGELILSDKGLQALENDINTLKSLGFWNVPVEKCTIHEMELYMEHKAEVDKLSPSDRQIYLRELNKVAEEESYWKL